MMKRNVACFGLVALLVGLVCGPFAIPSADSVAAAPEADNFRATSVRSILRRDGVWRSRGYGWIWEVKGRKIKVFDKTRGACTYNDDDDELADDLDGPIYVSRDRKTIKLTNGDPKYQYIFDRIDRLPRLCRRSQSTRPIAIFDTAVETFSKHYPFFKVRGVDWVRHVETVRPAVSESLSDVQLFGVIKRLLSPINDAHVNIRAEIDGEDYYFRPRRPRRAITARERAAAMKGPGYWSKDIGPDLLGTGARILGDERVQYGLIGRDIGYLMVESSGWGLRRALGRRLDRALYAMRNTKALVIDLTRNYGGTDTTARAFTRRFLKQRTLGYYRYAGDDPKAKPQAIYLQPSRRRRYTKPIYLITSRTTISAAELIVLVLKGLPHVTHIGQVTRGSLSDVLRKRLANGWTLSLSNEIYLSRDKTSWEGVGIAPDIPVTVVNDDVNTTVNVSAAQRVLSFIRSRL